MARKKDPLAHLEGPHSKVWSKEDIQLFVDRKIYTAEECREISLRGSPRLRSAASSACDPYPQQCGWGLCPLWDQSSRSA
jgi:hypothetical protein